MEGHDFPAHPHPPSLKAVTNLEADLARELERYAPAVSFQTFSEFTEIVEESAEPVMGTATETLLPANGMLLMYGDGGAGKTTLSVDAAAHLGSGTPWLGIEVSRPMRVLLVENEGPRGKFRQMLKEKSDAWQGAPFAANLTVLEEPWTQFTLQQDAHRASLAEHVAEHEVDVVFMGPLVTLGMVGGGTPDEVSAFEHLIAQTRTECSRPFALWFLHHENKVGDVSGAWERVPDTLMHVQGRGNGHTSIVWKKARWSSERHGTTMNLVWTDGRSYEPVEKDEVTEEDLEELILNAVREHPGEAWTNVRKHITGVGVAQRDTARDRMLKYPNPPIVNVPKRAGGFNLWLSDDPLLNRTEAGTERVRNRTDTPAEGVRDGTVQPYHRPIGTVVRVRNEQPGSDEPEEQPYAAGTEPLLDDDDERYF